LLILACAALAGVYGTSAGWFGPHDPRSAFLDAVSVALAKDPRVSIVSVDRAKGEMVVAVLPIKQTFTLVITKVESKTLGNGQTVEEWSFEWRDPSGTVVEMGHVLGSVGKAVHVNVPGLPRG
jgi:hypothetical protein